MTPDEEQDLHRALCAGRSDAPLNVVTAFLEPLIRRLQQRFPSLRGDPDLDGCALKVLADYCEQPTLYRPELGSLEQYLWHAAYRDAINLHEKLTRFRGEPLNPETVAEAGDGRNDPGEWLDALLGEVPGLPPEVTLEELWGTVRAALPERERKLLQLILAREADHASCVALLGLEGEAAEVQQREVKRARDRVQAALRRTRERFRQRESRTDE